MNNRERNLLVGLFILLVASIPFSTAINSFATIIFSTFSIWIYIKHKSFDRKFLVYFWFNIAFSLVFILGFIYTEDLRTGLKLFETRAALLFFPILLILTGKLWDHQLIGMALLSFAFSVITAGFIIHTGLLIDLVQQNKPLLHFFNWRVGGSHLSQRIGIHPTYLSMYVILSVGIVYELLIKNGSKLKRILGASFLVYLTVLTLHLASRISFVVLLLVLAVIFADLIRQHGWRMLFAIVPIVMCGGWLFSSESFAIKSRLQNRIGLEMEFLSGDKTPTDSLYHDERTFAWYGSAKIIKENTWLGVGSGDVVGALNTIYDELNAGQLSKGKLNSHNQFFDALMRNGILGLISLLFLYLHGLFEGRLKRLYLIFVLIITVTSLTENILERQKGTVFFGVFSALLYRYSKQDEKLIYDQVNTRRSRS